MDLKFNHVCLPGNELCAEHSNYAFHTELDPLLHHSDVILTDALPSAYQNTAYYKKYQITLKKLRQTPPHTILNPCPPFFRGEEVSVDAIESDYFVGYAFKKNLLHVQQAIILYCCGIHEL